MDKKMLQDTFREWKKVSGAKYAITNPDGLGDCGSCVSYALAEKYGEDSKGMWVGHWTRGMNAGYPLDDDRVKRVYINHDIDEDMAKAVYEVFGKNYNVLPAEYNPYLAFVLYEKDTPVWSVSYTDAWQGKTRSYSDEYLREVDAIARLNGLFNAGHKDATMRRVF